MIDIEELKKTCLGKNAPINAPTVLDLIAILDEQKRALEQACKDLQGAHNELMTAQGCSNPQDYDWPSWSPQANTIRWSEKLLNKQLGKRGAQS